MSNLTFRMGVALEHLLEHACHLTGCDDKIPPFLHCCVLLQLPSLEKRRKKRSVYSSESLVRGVRFLRYCLVCSASLFRAMVSWRYYAHTALRAVRRRNFTLQR